MTIGEDQAFHLHALFTVLGGVANEGDLIARFEQVSAPTPVYQKIRAGKFAYPFDRLAASVLHSETDQRVRIDELKIGDGCLHRHYSGHVIFRGPVVSEQGQ